MNILFVERCKTIVTRRSEFPSAARVERWSLSRKSLESFVVKSMYRRRRRKDCRKYEKWKKERASKQTEKGTERRKRREPVIDGLADDGESKEVTHQPPKARYRECRTKVMKGAKETPRRCIRKLVRRISYAELVLGCVKPSLEERKYLLDPRHIRCIGLSVDIAPETPSNAKTISLFDACLSFSLLSTF